MQRLEPGFVRGLRGQADGSPALKMMTNTWAHSVIRCAVYLYFAGGMALLNNGGMVSALRYQADKRFPASFLLVVSVGIFGVLAFANWDAFRRPLSLRKWIVLCLLASFGVVELLFAPTQYGGSAT
jgi:hypothetical protein